MNTRFSPLHGVINKLTRGRLDDLSPWEDLFLICAGWLGGIGLLIFAATAQMLLTVHGSPHAEHMFDTFKSVGLPLLLCGFLGVIWAAIRMLFAHKQP